MAMKAVTQSRIAEALGVSRNTVSRALNNDVGVSEEMRKKIRDTAIGTRLSWLLTSACEV